jgi:hypothetical protein
VTRAGHLEAAITLVEGEHASIGEIAGAGDVHAAIDRLLRVDREDDSVRWALTELRLWLRFDEAPGPPAEAWAPLAARAGTLRAAARSLNDLLAAVADSKPGCGRLPSRWSGCFGS